MKTKLLLLVMLALPLMAGATKTSKSSTPYAGSNQGSQAYASEATHLRVHRSDGTVVNALLDEQLVLDFLIANTTEYMTLKSESEDTQIALVEIQKMTFGEAIVPETPDTEEPVEPELPEGSELIHIYHTNGTVFSASLDEQVVLRFLADNMQVSILQQEPMPWLLDEVQKITFSIVEEETPDTPTEIEDCVVRDEDCDVRKILENGQVIIIKNGVRYNILGIRL